MILLVDNYDSFSYNLYQLVGTLNPDIHVIRNDELDVQGVAALAPQAIILSPGPGYPRDAGICVQLARELGPKIPMLGVCLGHQSICEAFGATIGHAPKLMHGKQSLVTLDTNSPVFAGLPKQVKGARYHSLVALEKSMPACLTVTARAHDGEIMAVQHESAPIFGVQFHPESFMTPEGPAMLHNFLNFALKGR